jgi:hypothetical protein
MSLCRTLIEGGCAAAAAAVCSMCKINGSERTVSWIMTSYPGVSVLINYQTDEGAAMQVQHPFTKSAPAAVLLSVTR